MEYIWFYQYPVADSFKDYDKNYFKVYFSDTIFLFKNITAAKRFIKVCNLYLSDLVSELQMFYFEAYRVFLFDVLDYEHKKKLNDLAIRIQHCFIGINKPFLKHYILAAYINSLFELLRDFVLFLQKNRYKIYADYLLRRLVDAELIFLNFGEGRKAVVYVFGAPTVSEKLHQSPKKDL